MGRMMAMGRRRWWMLNTCEDRSCVHEDISPPHPDHFISSGRPDNDSVDFVLTNETVAIRACGHGALA